MSFTLSANFEQSNRLQMHSCDFDLNERQFVAHNAQ